MSALSVAMIEPGRVGRKLIEDFRYLLTKPLTERYESEYLLLLVLVE